MAISKRSVMLMAGFIVTAVSLFMAVTQESATDVYGNSVVINAPFYDDNMTPILAIVTVMLVAIAAYLVARVHKSDS